MADEVKFEKLNGSIALFTIENDIYDNVDQFCNYLSQKLNDLEKEGHLKFIFDLQSLNFLDSNLVGLLAKRYYTLKNKGGGLAILNASDVVYKSIEMSGLADLIEFYDDKDAAFKSFKGK